MITQILFPHRVQPALKVYRRNRSGWTRYATGTVCGMGGGFVFPILGGLLTAAASVHGQAHNFNYYFGTVLFLLTVPLLVFGILCLVRVVDDSMPKR